MRLSISIKDHVERSLSLVDIYLNNVSVLCTIRSLPATIWALSSLALFIDTFIYTLTVSILPEILQKNMNAPASSNGVVTTMFGVGSVIGSSASGILSDYIGNRRMLQIVGSLFYTSSGIILFYSRHYFQILLFRLVDGIASGIACTLLYASVGDVYPADLLGFKVAIIYFCNNIGYTIGPVCGQRLFSASGIKGPALVVIALGLLKFVLLVIFAEDSLVIRKKLRTELIIFQQASSDVAVVEAPGSQELEANKHPDKKSASLRRVNSEQSQDAAIYSPNSTHKVSILRVLTRPPVLVSTLVIITCIGIQCMLEGIVPLYLVDTLNHTHDDGMTFVVVGLVFTLAAPVVGKASDMIILWQGERMRYYIMLFGAIAIIANVMVMALFKTYTAMMVGYALFAVSNLCMFIPAQSAYGDFVNGSDTNTMARGYSIAVFSWAAGAICLPPIGTAFYLIAGFTKPAIVITVVTCVISAGACQAYIIWGRNALAHVE